MAAKSKNPSYIQMISQAILSKADKRMSSTDICKYVRDNWDVCKNPKKFNNLINKRLQKNPFIKEGDLYKINVTESKNSKKSHNTSKRKKGNTETKSSFGSKNPPKPPSRKVKHGEAVGEFVCCEEGYKDGAHFINVDKWDFINAQTKKGVDERKV